MTDTVPIGLIVVRLTQPVKNYPVGTELGYKDVADAIAALGSAHYFEVVRDQQGNPIPPLTPEEIEEAQRAAQRRAKSRRLILGADFDPLWNRVEGIPSAEELTDMQAAVDAVADVPPRVEAVETQVSAVETKVARVDPGEYAGAVGQSLSQGPSGPAWKRDAVSADWFSNPNDAIAAAGPGGTVRFSAGTTYTLVEPIGLIPGISLIGESNFVSRASYAAWNNGNAAIIEADGFAAFAVADPSEEVLEVALSGMVVVGKGTAPIGVDLRGVAHSRIDNMSVRELASGGVAFWVGGDVPAYRSGWSNTLSRVFAYVPTNGSGIRFSGVTNTGAPTANNTTVLRAAISFRGDGGRGIDMQDGDTNLIMHSDIGYRTNIIPFYLGGRSRQSTFFRNRAEAVSRAVLIEDGRHHTFIGNMLGGDDPAISPVVIAEGSGHMFWGNRYAEAARTPRIDGSRFNYKSNDIGEQTWFRDTPQFLNGGGAAFEVKSEFHNHKTFDIRGDYGVLEWFNRSTGAKIGEFRPFNESGSHFHWMDGMLIKVPKVTALPAASAALRGVTVRVEGGTGVADGLYHCRKKADDTYEWVNQTP